MIDGIPKELSSGPVQLVYEITVRGAPSRGLVPYHRFRIIGRSGNEAGHISLRIGSTRHVMMTAGHIGYAVLPEYRGFSYAYYACIALKPLIRLHYNRVILTADPENAPSRHIIEKLGARFINEVAVPADDPAYAKGARRKSRYQWEL